MNHNFHVPRGLPIQPGQKIQPKQKPSKTDSSSATEFQELLKQHLQQDEVKFSAHAEKRLAARNIQLSPKQIEALQKAVNQAADRGGRESLVLVDDLAFVVSVKNRTVITAMDGDSVKDNVFTNIDSAVVTRDDS